jgi:hypothetical protein
MPDFDIGSAATCVGGSLIGRRLRIIAERRRKPNKAT